MPLAAFIIRYLELLLSRVGRYPPGQCSPEREVPSSHFALQGSSSCNTPVQQLQQVLRLPIPIVRSPKVSLILYVCSYLPLANDAVCCCCFGIWRSSFVPGNLPGLVCIISVITGSSKDVLGMTEYILRIMIPEYSTYGYAAAAAAFEPCCGGMLYSDSRCSYLRPSIHERPMSEPTTGSRKRFFRPLLQGGEREDPRRLRKHHACIILPLDYVPGTRSVCVHHA